MSFIKNKLQLRVFLSQLNPIVGDLAGNVQKAYLALQRASQNKADLLLLSELFLCGYPVGDLVLDRAFLSDCDKALHELAKQASQYDIGILIGCPREHNGNIYNAVVLLMDGKIQEERYKISLPNYDEFDEKRIFTAAHVSNPVYFKGFCLGVPICEDIWVESEALCKNLAAQGVELFLVPNASPYNRGKLRRRHMLVQKHAQETGCAFAYLNQIGGQDELVFDGGSFAYDAHGTCVLQMHSFQEEDCLLLFEKSDRVSDWKLETRQLAPTMPEEASDYQACVLGLRDYVEKNNFPHILLGLSGGVDSALCATMAVDALGPDRVHGFILPYIYTSEESLKDAQDCANRLGISAKIIEINQPVESFFEILAPVFSDNNPDVTEENIQSRTRGVVLMALSNKFGGLLLTTGNKSEIAVGYSTLYGDMNGGFNPIKDLYKTEVYELCFWRNSHQVKGGLGPSGSVIPSNILQKAPSAELRDGQTDQDSLPPYPVLDKILFAMIEQNMSVAEIVASGQEREIVLQIQSLLYKAEYKRFQSAPGVKLSTRAFGRDRRYPLTNHYRDMSE